MLGEANSLHGHLDAAKVLAGAQDIGEVDHGSAHVQVLARLDDQQTHLALVRNATREQLAELRPALGAARDCDELLRRPQHRLARRLGRGVRGDGALLRWLARAHWPCA